MKTRYRVIQPGEALADVAWQEIDWPREPGYREIKGLIGPILGEGRDLEHVSVLHDDRRADMFVDECGSNDRLPRNEAATAIYRRYWLSTHRGADPETIAAIYGVAILFERIVWT